MTNWQQLLNASTTIVRDTFGEPCQLNYADGLVVYLTAVFEIEPSLIPFGDIAIDSHQIFFTLRKCDLQRKPTEYDEIITRNTVFGFVEINEDAGAFYRCRAHQIDTSNQTNLIDIT